MKTNRYKHERATLAPKEDDLPVWAVVILIPAFGAIGGFLLAIAIGVLP